MPRRARRGIERAHAADRRWSAKDLLAGRRASGLLAASVEGFLSPRSYVDRDASTHASSRAAALPPGRNDRLLPDLQRRFWVVAQSATLGEPEREERKC